MIEEAIPFRSLDNFVIAVAAEMYLNLQNQPATFTPTLQGKLRDVEYSDALDLTFSLPSWDSSGGILAEEVERKCQFDRFNELFVTPFCHGLLLSSAGNSYQQLKNEFIRLRDLAHEADTEYYTEPGHYGPKQNEFHEVAHSFAEFVRGLINLRVDDSRNAAHVDSLLKALEEKSS